MAGLDVSKNVTKVNEIARSNRALNFSRNRGSIVTFRSVRVAKSWWKNLPCTALRRNLCLGRSREIRKTTDTVCQESLDRANADEMFTKHIIAGDGTWVYVVMTLRQKSSDRHTAGRQILHSNAHNK